MFEKQQEEFDKFMKDFRKNPFIMLYEHVCKELHDMRTGIGLIESKCDWLNQQIKDMREKLNLKEENMENNKLSEKEVYEELEKKIMDFFQKELTIEKYPKLFEKKLHIIFSCDPNGGKISVKEKIM